MPRRPLACCNFRFRSSAKSKLMRGDGSACAWFGVDVGSCLAMQHFPSLLDRPQIPGQANSEKSCVTCLEEGCKNSCTKGILAAKVWKWKRYWTRTTSNDSYFAADFEKTYHPFVSLILLQTWSWRPFTLHCPPGPGRLLPKTSSWLACQRSRLAICRSILKTKSRSSRRHSRAFQTTFFLGGGSVCCF